MKISNIYNHFKTISTHKLVVMKECFAVGLIKQGLLHDLSKYSPTEFLVGVKYYQGTRSPNAAEKEEKGYSTAWLHHKGRNKHHFEYYIDNASKGDRELVGHPMPVRYVVEMFMDRIAASRVYKGDDYTDSMPYEYYERSRYYYTINEKTDAQLKALLVRLKDQGEEKTFNYIRALLYRDRIRRRRKLVASICAFCSDLKKSSSSK